LWESNGAEQLPPIAPIQWYQNGCRQSSGELVVEVKCVADSYHIAAGKPRLFTTAFLAVSVRNTNDREPMKCFLRRGNYGTALLPGNECSHSLHFRARARVVGVVSAIADLRITCDFH
jgi:hypothetical protein